MLDVWTPGLIINLPIHYVCLQVRLPVLDVWTDGLINLPVHYVCLQVRLPGRDVWTDGLIYVPVVILDRRAVPVQRAKDPYHVKQYAEANLP